MSEKKPSLKINLVEGLNPVGAEFRKQELDKVLSDFNYGVWLQSLDYNPREKESIVVHLNSIRVAVDILKKNKQNIDAKKLLERAIQVVRPMLQKLELSVGADNMSDSGNFILRAVNFYNQL